MKGTFRRGLSQWWKGFGFFTGKLLKKKKHPNEYLSAKFRLLCSSHLLFLSLHSWDGRDGAHSSESTPWPRKNLRWASYVQCWLCFMTCPDVSPRTLHHARVCINALSQLVLESPPTWRVYHSRLNLEEMLVLSAGQDEPDKTTDYSFPTYTEGVMLMPVGQGVEMSSDCQTWICYFSFCLHPRPLFYFTLCCQYLHVVTGLFFLFIYFFYCGLMSAKS